MTEIQKQAKAKVQAARAESYHALAIRINGGTQTSDQEMFDSLKRGENELPTGPLLDPTTDQFVYDIRSQHKLMIREWRQVFDRHQNLPPERDDFSKEYLQYTNTLTKAQSCLHSGQNLYKRAQKAKEHISAGSDGFKLKELKALPPLAWKERAKLLRLCVELGHYVKPYHHINTPALRTKGKKPAPLNHRLLTILPGTYRIESIACDFSPMAPNHSAPRSDWSLSRHGMRGYCTGLTTLPRKRHFVKKKTSFCPHIFLEALRLIRLQISQTLTYCLRPFRTSTNLQLIV